jgi:hypothetical protein
VYVREKPLALRLRALHHAEQEGAYVTTYPRFGRAGATLREFCLGHFGPGLSVYGGSPTPYVWRGDLWTSSSRQKIATFL